MQGNLNPSARVAIAAVIPPASLGVGTVVSGWVSMAAYHSMLATLNVGAIGGGGTVDAKIEQATDAAGTGAKPVAGLVITQLVKAGGDNRQSLINIRPEDMDKNGGFKFVRLSMTVGGAATLAAGMIIGLDPRYGAAPAGQVASVAETVS